MAEDEKRDDELEELRKALRGLERLRKEKPKEYAKTMARATKAMK